MNRLHLPRSGRGRAGRFAWLLALVPIAALGFATVGTAAPTTGSTDLRITKTDSPDPVHIGATLTYAIKVENLGPIAATGVVVTDTLPKGVDFVSASSTAGPCTQQARKVSCTLGSVGVGVNYSTPAGATVAVIPRQAGTITNTASVKGDQKDPVANNNQASATTRVLGVASCRGVPATIVGTPGNDVLVGTGGDDVIVALGGDDRITSLAGRDLVCAGAGNDEIVAGSAADRVFAGAGRDRLLGRGGPDVLKGAAGNDVLKGGRGSDRLRGGRGFDICNGGPGADSIRGCER
ncbi:MAG: hypothetical protein QOF23_643 [Solirubrobacterales bacterium]|jgi:uncharacterized repeat protein (TIGR01451 family)|nr:hypothetical protein [Solirubrobacterales bacterium]